MTCKTLEQAVLNTSKVRQVIDEYEVRTLEADWGTEDESIGRLMDQLQGSRQIPLLAVFPAGSPNEPIIFQAQYTQGALIKALREASGSKRIAASLP